MARVRNDAISCGGDDPNTIIHFGGTVSLGTSLSPLGMYAGYLLMQSGNFWLALCFLVLTTIFFLVSIASLCRYVINFHRNKHLLRPEPAEARLLLEI